MLCNNEGHLRSKHGRGIPYQCLSTFGLNAEFFRRPFARLTPCWSRLEVPRGCVAELPAVFTYRIRELMDPASLWWTVAYTKLAAKTAALVLLELFDSCRLWDLSHEMIEGMRRLNLQSVLGNNRNASERCRFLDAIGTSRFRDLLSTWSSRGMLPSLSPGRTDKGADYRFYNPFTGRFITAEEATVVLRGMDRRLPAGYPTGWDYSELEDEFVSSNADLVQLRTSFGGWGDEKESDDEPIEV